MVRRLLAALLVVGALAIGMLVLFPPSGGTTCAGQRGADGGDLPVQPRAADPRQGAL